MAKKIVLLAGLHKTATTSIQNTCLAHRKMLGKAGFCYPRAEASEGSRGNHTFLLKELFREQPDRIGLASQFGFGQKIPQEAQEKGRAEFAAALTGQSCPTILLVAEGVSIFSVSEMQNLRQWVSDQGFSLRVICHVRHLSSWIQSMVSQRVAGIVALTIPEAMKEFVDAGGVVRPRIEAIKRAFPDAEFYSHERAVRHSGGPVGFFLDSIGFVDRPPLRVVRANEGRSDVATRVISLINERFGRSGWVGPLDQLERHLRSTGMRGMRELPGHKFSLRTSEVEPIRRMLEEENDWLRDTLGQDFYDARIEFGSGSIRWTPEALAMLNGRLEQCLPEVGAWVAENAGRLRLTNPGDARRRP